MITRANTGGCTLTETKKKILIAYLKAHKLPFPKYEGNHVPLEFAIFNDHGGYYIPDKAKRFLNDSDNSDTELDINELSNLDFKEDSENQ